MARIWTEHWESGFFVRDSNFTHAEASWTQSLADWIGAHTCNSLDLI